MAFLLLLSVAICCLKRLCFQRFQGLFVAICRNLFLSKMCGFLTSVWLLVWPFKRPHIKKDGQLTRPSAFVSTPHWNEFFNAFKVKPVRHNAVNVVINDHVVPAPPVKLIPGFIQCAAEPPLHVLFSSCHSNDLLNKFGITMPAKPRQSALVFN